MSDILNLMEVYVKNTRYPKLNNFCDLYQYQVENYIGNLDNASVAKRNLEKKFKDAFTNIKGKSKRGPGLNIEINNRFIEAKETQLLAENAWSSLAESFCDVLNEDNISNDEDEGEDSNHLANKFDEYKQRAKRESESKGFFIDGNLQEILSLSDVLFIKENEYSKEQVKCFSEETLDDIKEDFVEKFMDTDIKFDNDIYGRLSTAIKEYNDHKSERILKQSINDIAKDSNDDDFEIIDILINLINKLPPSTRNDEIGESELQGTYIDPIMYPLFNRSKQNRYFRWHNHQVAHTVTRRPDGHIYSMNQKDIDLSIGFAEIKPQNSESSKQHEDTLRLAAFCKDSLESKSLKVTIAVQVIGFYVSFYLFAPVNDIYVMADIISIEVPSNLNQLSRVLDSFDSFKRLAACLKNNKGVSEEERTRKRSRALDIPELNRIINVKKPKGSPSSLKFKK